MTEPFKVGDVVQLKSGGLKTTVVGTSTNSRGEPLVSCAWFAKENATTNRIVPLAGGVAVRWYSNFEKFTGELPQDMLDMLSSPETLQQGTWHARDQFEYAYALTQDADIAVYFSTFRWSFAVATLVTEDVARFEGLSDIPWHRPRSAAPLSPY
jgi:uncharacterized protein YodC (DUF2158 family)